MIGTAIIAIVGYSVAAFFAVATCICILELRKASLRRDVRAAANRRDDFFVGIALTLGFATLTRWLTGGLL